MGGDSVFNIDAHKSLFMENRNDKCLDDTNCSDSKNATFKTKRSLVWNFFQKISRQRVQCRLCKHEQNYQGTTGNILRHLKSRHSLDVTIKGQRDPHNQVLIKELMSMTSSATTSSDYEQKPIIVRKTSVASDSSHTSELYTTNNDDNQVNFKNGSSIFYQELQEDCIYNDDKKEQDQKSARKEKLEENRILAETEYYREKAAYFRIQKHFTALQAKKVKLEIDQFVSNNKS